MSTNIFEQASRLKLRFETPQGKLDVESLWDLPLTSTTNKANLDDIARTLYKRVQEANTVSFVTTPASADVATNLAFEIVKHVIEVKKAENKTAEDRKKKQEKNRLIADLIAKKQVESLESKSLEELMAMMNEE